MENDINKKRSGFLPMLALIKKNIVSAFDVITVNNVFRFKLDNDKVFYSYLSQLSNKLDSLNQNVANLPKIEFKDSPASIQIQTMGNETIKNIISGLSDLKKTIESSRAIVPKIQEVRGSVEVRNQQFIPYDRMLSSLKSIEDKIGRIRVEIPPMRQQDIHIPEYPKEMNIPEMKFLLDALKEMNDELKKLPKTLPEIIIPNKVSVDNFPPQKYPMPVTNININALRGEVKTRAVTVTTALTPLPGEVLSYRRGITIYNNGSVTVYIGGSTMTVSDGLPVAAGSYSPALDAGPKMILYGRTASGSSDVRVMEVSNENIGN